MSDRLRLLTDILAGSRVALTGALGDLAAGEQRLNVVPFDRIRQLAAFLENGGPHVIDDLETLSGHLLLSDVAIAVAHLRAITQITASRIDAVGGSLKPVRKFLNQQARLQEKSRQRRR